MSVLRSGRTKPFRFRNRRILQATALVVAVAIVAVVLTRLKQQLVSTGYLSGYVLAGILLFLSSFNVRKRLPYLPIGSASMWLQFHVYLGIAALPLFLWHGGAKMPNGVLESTLAALFVLTWLSGVYGLYITRRIPRQLTQMPLEYLAEEIPWHIAKVRTQAYEVVRHAHRKSSQSILADFYLRHLFVYFERPRSFMYVIYPTSHRRRHLQEGLRDIGRYLSTAEYTLRDRLMELVQIKDDLDFHGALQAILRLWLFLHIGLTVMLITLGSVHGVLALAFRGSS